MPKPKIYASWVFEFTNQVEREKEMKTIMALSAYLLLTVSVFGADRKVAEHLQDVSVTIKSESDYSKSEGSGVLFIRKIGDEEVTFVWTAGHVVDNLRNVRTVIDSKGAPRKVVEFKDAQVVKELVEAGRRVGEIKMDARVIKYSNADDGHDLALLMVRSRGYGKSSTKFHLPSKDKIVPIGTDLYHVGSLRGQMGANSMTSGIVSQVGRTLDKYEYDQTTATAFPGSSGGGIFLKSGEYVGMLVRGAGENFNLFVPMRRMYKWAATNKILWSIDPSVEAPKFSELVKMPIEAVGLGGDDDDDDDGDSKSFPFLILREARNSNIKSVLDRRPNK